MRVGWRRLGTESAGVGEKRLWLTGLTCTNTPDCFKQHWRLSCSLEWASCCRSQHLWGTFLRGGGYSIVCNIDINFGWYFSRQKTKATCRSRWVTRRSARCWGSCWTSDRTTRLSARRCPKNESTRCTLSTLCASQWARSYRVMEADSFSSPRALRRSSSKSKSDQSVNQKQAVVRKHNKPRPRVAHRGIARFLGIDQICNQVVTWSLHTFPESFMQIGLAVCS